MYLPFFRAFLLVILTAFLSIRCSENKSAESSASASCTETNEALGNPQTIEETIALINALPKPASIDCFLNSLKGPLKVFAVNNGFSAQPAVDQASPRIFILKDKLVLSVVPAGTGRNLLEFGELNGTLDSFKGEVQFPVTDTVTIDTIMSHISETTSTSTCITCHSSERKAPYRSLGNLFVSRFVRPNESQRVQYPYLRAQASSCNPAINKVRCDILSAIYTKGQAEDGAFPY